MFEQVLPILDHVEATLTSLPVLSGWGIHRDDYVAISADDLPAVVLVPHLDRREGDEDNDNRFETRVLTLVIEVRTTGHPVSTTTLPIARAIATALMDDRRQGGLAWNTRVVTLQLEGEKSDKDYARAALTIEITYRTKG